MNHGRLHRKHQGVSIEQQGSWQLEPIFSCEKHKNFPLEDNKQKLKLQI